MRAIYNGEHSSSEGGMAKPQGNTVALLHVPVNSGERVADCSRGIHGRGDSGPVRQAGFTDPQRDQKGLRVQPRITRRERAGNKCADERPAKRHHKALGLLLVCLLSSSMIAGTNGRANNGKNQASNAYDKEEYKQHSRNEFAQIFHLVLGTEILKADIARQEDTIRQLLQNY